MAVDPDGAYARFMQLEHEIRQFNRLMEAAWTDYDSTVEWQNGDRREHLEMICKKYGVSPLDVLEWRHETEEDENR